MSQDFAHLRAFLAGQPWAMLPEYGDVVLAILQRRLEGIRLSEAELAGIRGRRQPNGILSYVSMAESGPLILSAEQRVGANPAPGSQLAVLNVMGVIANRMSMIDDISGPGGTSTERVQQSLSQATADPSVKAVILKVDSPGGGVFGVQELAQQIADSKTKAKPIVAQVAGQCCSAAYWIAAACSEIVASPSSMVGSIGVFMLHQDVSGAMTKAGVASTFISSTPEKVEGNALEPLSDAAAQALQDTVMGYYQDFVAAVASGRKTTQANVRSSFGQGRTVRSGDALKAGMIDSIGTMDDTLARLGAPRGAQAAKALAGDAPEAGGGAAVLEATATDETSAGSAALDAAAQETVAEAPEIVQSDEDRAAYRRQRHRSRARWAS